MRSEGAASGIELMSDVSAASWIEESLWEWPSPEGGVPLGSLLPEGFASYARLLHPAQTRGEQNVLWHEVAASTGRVAHADMQWERISLPGEGTDRKPWDGYPPTQGELPKGDLVALADLLGDFTSTPDDCWFSVWDGYGFFHPGAIAYLTDATTPRRPEPPLKGPWMPPSQTPRVRVPGREYFLYRGSLSAVGRFQFGPVFQSPNLWWPEDHAWCVATEIDLRSTYVGGSEACIARLLDSSRFEVLPTNVQARVDIGGDHLNESAPEEDAQGE